MAAIYREDSVQAHIVLSTREDFYVELDVFRDEIPTIFHNDSNLRLRPDGAIYASSAERTAALDGWLWHCSHHRKRSALGRQPPIIRLNKLPASYS